MNDHLSHKRIEVDSAAASAGCERPAAGSGEYGKAYYWWYYFYAYQACHAPSRTG